jgi:hypothetical protein
VISGIGRNGADGGTVMGVSVDRAARRPTS